MDAASVGSVLVRDIDRFYTVTDHLQEEFGKFNLGGYPTFSFCYPVF